MVEQIFQITKRHYSLRSLFVLIIIIIAMNLKKVAIAHVFLFLYITSNSLIDLALRVLLWGAVFLIIFREKLLPKLGKVTQKLSSIQVRILARMNRYLGDFTVARIVKTLLLFKVVLFFTWLLPQWMIVFALVESWAFKEQVRPVRQTLKEMVKGTVKTIQHKGEELVKQIPRYNRNNF